MKRSKRLVSTLLALAMIAALMPISAAAEGVEKTPTTISTVPQYVKSGETLISNDTSGASTAKSLDYGTPVYFLLRTASGSAGNIADPDYVDPAKFDITFSGTQGVDTGGLALVKESSVGGVFWYLKVPLIEQGSLTGDTAVQGSIVIAPKAGGTSFTLNLTARNITLRAAVTGDQPIVSLATQAQAMGESGVISTMTKAQCQTLQYGDVFYYAVRTTGSSYLTAVDDLTPSKYTCGYTPGSGESFNAVKSVELVYDKNTATSFRWWIKITLIDKPASAPAVLDLNGAFTITASDPATNVSMAPKDGNYPLAVTFVKTDLPIESLATQAQSKGTNGVISTMSKTQCQALEYGGVFYYAVRTTGSSYLTAEDDLTSSKYTCGYTPGSGEPFNAVKSVELVYDRNTETTSRWWIKAVLIDKPAGAPAKLDLNGVFTITASDPATNASMAPRDGNYPLAVVTVKTDTVVDNLGTQAQGMGSDGYISTLGKNDCIALQYGDVIYYPVRAAGNSNITGLDELTPEKYTCSYTKGTEAFDPVKSVELVYKPTSASASRWWIQVTFIDKPVGAPESLPVDGSFRITSSELGISVSMSPKDGNYPLALRTGALTGVERIVTKTSTAPQYIKDGDTLIAQNGTSSSSSSFPFGQTIYFILRDSSGDIISPDYIVPEDYTVECDSAQVSSCELVAGKYSGGERWYVKLVLAAQESGEEDAAVTGTLKLMHKDGGKATLDLTARGITLTTDSAPRPFTRVATWAQRRNAEGVVKSISGASSNSPTVEYGEAIYYALANGSNTSLTGIDLFDPEDYIVTYTPTGENDFDPFDYLILSYEPFETSSSSGSKWFLKLQTTDDAQGLMLADGVIEIFRASDNKMMASLDLGANVPLIFGGEDDTTNDRGIRTVTLVHHVNSTKMVENDEGYVGRASSDLGTSSNVGYGETAYYMLVGVDKFGGEHPITDPDAVENIRIKTDFSQNADKVESIEIVKKRSYAYGKYGFYYFLAINIVEKNNWTSRYTIFGDITLSKKGKYGITNKNNECTLFIDTTVGPEKTSSRVDVEDMEDRDELLRLDEEYRRYNFGDLGTDGEDVFYFFGMSDDNYFTVNTNDQDDILLGNTVEYNEEIGALYPDAELFFFNGGTKEFNHHGIMTFAASPGTYLYRRNGSMLTRIDGLKYDDDEQAYHFYTKNIGSYVFSDRELDYDRYNISRVAPWAQAENEDGTISTINGCEFKGAYVEYGSTIYYALRNGEDKTITDKMALESGHFTYGFESKDPNAPAIKEAGITFRTNWIKSSDTRTKRYYVAVTFAEVPDPGGPRTVSGDLIIYYKGEEVTRLPLGPTEQGDYTLTLHGGRPVANDWIPRDYVVPVLRTEEEIEELPVATLLDSEETGTSADIDPESVDAGGSTSAVGSKAPASAVSSSEASEAPTKP